MIVMLRSWWQARSSRERLLLSAGAVIIFLIVAPLAVYQQVDSYRRSAATDLAAARTLLSDVGKIAAAKPTKTVSGDAREVSVAAAAASGLTIARIEPVGGDGVIVVFGVSDSRSIYQWMDTVGAGGLNVRRSTIVRADEGALVTAEFEIGKRR